MVRLRGFTSLTGIKDKQTNKQTNKIHYSGLDFTNRTSIYVSQNTFKT